MSLARVEMSGPLAAILQQQTASSPSDFQAYLFGHRILSKTSMATDFEENKKVETTKLVVTKFVVAKAEDDICQGKTITNRDLAAILKTNKSKTCNDRVDFLGFLSFKKAWSTSWPFTPSYQDCKKMSLLQKTESMEQFYVFHLLGEMATDHCGTKSIGATYLVEKGRESREGPWVEKVPLKIPNLCLGVGLQYKHARKGGNSKLKTLMSEVGMDQDIASIKRMNDKFHGLNQLMEKKARVLGEEIKLDEVDLRGLQEEVDDLEQSLFQKMEQSSLVQRSKKMMYGQAVDAAIMLLEEKRNDQGSNVTRVMSDLSIGRDSD